MKEELRQLDEVLKSIRKQFDFKGYLGVQGFSITLRSELGSINMNWGDLKIRRRPKTMEKKPKP